MPLAAAPLAGLQLPLQQGLFLWELILRQPFVGPVVSACISCFESIESYSQAKHYVNIDIVALHVLYKGDHKMCKPKLSEQSVVRHVMRMLDKSAQHMKMGQPLL